MTITTEQRIEACVAVEAKYATAKESLVVRDGKLFCTSTGFCGGDCPACNLFYDPAMDRPDCSKCWLPKCGNPHTPNSPWAKMIRAMKAGDVPKTLHQMDEIIRITREHREKLEAKIEAEKMLPEPDAEWLKSIGYEKVGKGIPTKENCDAWEHKGLLCSFKDGDCPAMYMHYGRRWLLRKIVEDMPPMPDAAEMKRQGLEYAGYDVPSQENCDKWAHYLWPDTFYHWTESPGPLYGGKRHLLRKIKGACPTCGKPL